MGDFFGSVWWFIVALGLLVSFHEFGHFWVARRCGVKVLRFSVGFGRPLWRRVGSDGTEYVVAAIPLGGYVKMLDEREDHVQSAERDQAFNRKSLGQRSAIIAAGPIFNLVFAVAAFWAMFLFGVPELRPIFAEPTGVAADAGLRSGERIASIDDRTVETLTQTTIALLPHALDRTPVAIEIESASGVVRRAVLPLDRLGADFSEERLLESLGLSPWYPPLDAVVGDISPDFPAAVAGLQKGDRIIAINGRYIEDWDALSPAIQSAVADDPTLTVTVERDARELEVAVAPRNDEGSYKLGISPQTPSEEERALFTERMIVQMKFGVIESAWRAVVETWDMTAATLGLLKRMLTGDASVKNLSGPISIAQFANDSAAGGLSNFLRFLAFLSLSLAIINFLPVPLLDGGHLLYNLIEWLKGSPVSEQGQLAGQYIGLFALASLISLTLYNDILRLLS